MGILQIPPKEKYTTLCRRPSHQPQSRIFMVRMSCFVSGGSKRILHIMSWLNLALLLQANGIDYNRFLWAVHCEKKQPEYEQRSSYSSAWQRSALYRKRRKNICKCSNGMLYRTHRIQLTLLLLITG